MTATFQALTSTGSIIAALADCSVPEHPMMSVRGEGPPAATHGHNDFIIEPKRTPSEDVLAPVFPDSTRRDTNLTQDCVKRCKLTRSGEK
jgi:hypothetical protein